MVEVSHSQVDKKLKWLTDEHDIEKPKWMNDETFITWLELIFNLDGAPRLVHIPKAKNEILN